jgi:hypothetical protein
MIFMTLLYLSLIHEGWTHECQHLLTGGRQTLFVVRFVAAGVTLADATFPYS